MYEVQLTKCSNIQQQLEQHNECIGHDQRENEDLEWDAVKHYLHATSPAAIKERFYAPKLTKKNQKSLSDILEY